MILGKLVLENFRQIDGRNEIHFARPGDRNVTVILGQNGSGKTTLLHAFLWCLYEHIAVENPLEIGHSSLIPTVQPLDRGINSSCIKGSACPRVEVSTKIPLTS